MHVSGFSRVPSGVLDPKWIHWALHQEGELIMANITKQEVVNLFTASEGKTGVRIIRFAPRSKDEDEAVLTDKELIWDAQERAKKSGFARWDKEQQKLVPGPIFKRVEYARFSELVEAQEKRDQFFSEVLEEMDVRLERVEDKAEVMSIKRDAYRKMADYEQQHSGALRDHTADVGEPLNPNWITYTQGDERAANDDDEFILPTEERNAEVNPEAEDKVIPSLEKKNFLHLDWLKAKRDAKFEELKAGVLAAAREAWTQKNTDCLIQWERQIHRTRDASFEMKLLNMITAPENRNRNHYIKDAPKHIKELYESSRMLNYEQHEQLIDMLSVYRRAVVKRQKPNTKILDILWDLRSKGAKLLKDKETPQAQKTENLKSLNEKVMKLRASIALSEEEAAKAVKDVTEGMLGQFNLAKIERQFLIHYRDVLREKWEYYRDMVDALRTNNPTGINVFEQQMLLRWAKVKKVAVMKEAKKFTAKHNIKPTDTIESV